MTAWKGKREAPVFTGTDKFELRAGGAAVLNFLRAKLCRWAASESEHATARDFGKARDARIVRVQDRNAILPCQTFDQFAFGQSDFINRSEEFQMHGRYTRDDAHFGLGNFRKTPQLAAM